MALSEYQGYSQNDFSRSVQTTIAKHFADVEEAMLRNYKMGALLQSGGRIKTNQSGRGFEWDVQYRLHDIEGNTGETTRNFVRRNLWKKAYLEYRGYQATDAILHKELMENRGKEAQIKVYSGLVSRLEQSMKQGLANQYWIDGNASGNETCWHGIESFFGGTQTVNSTDGTARTANAADFVLYPNDTYAGLSTVLGNYDGDNESGAVWPNGVADPEYDFWSPLVVNYTSSGFGGAADTWAAQGDEAMRFANIHAMRNQLPNEITHIFLARNLYYQILNLLDDKERTIVDSTMDLRAFGFGQTFNFDGVQVTFENSISTNIGYGVNIRNVDLLVMDERLLRSEGPEYDIETQSYRCVVSTLSNLRFSSPRNFYKLKNIA